MDPGHKARKNPSDDADVGFQAVGLALRIMQLNIEGLSAAKRCIIPHTRRILILLPSGYVIGGQGHLSALASLLAVLVTPSK